MARFSQNKQANKKQQPQTNKKQQNKSGQLTTFKFQINNTFFSITKSQILQGHAYTKIFFNFFKSNLIGCPGFYVATLIRGSMDNCWTSSFLNNPL